MLQDYKQSRSWKLQIISITTNTIFHIRNKTIWIQVKSKSWMLYLELVSHDIL